jgi:hypothetical protein
MSPGSKTPRRIVVKVGIGDVCPDRREVVICLYFSFLHGDGAEETCEYEEGCA